MPHDNPTTQQLVARLRFRHLRLLVELQAAGSLRAAADTLNLTQPALSKALVEIEGAFGFALFTRNARGLKATERGAIAVRGAATLLEQLERLGVETSSTPPLAVLRIGAPPFIAQGYLPEPIAAARRRGLRVRVTLVEERVPLLVRLLLDGKVDALVSSFPATSPDLQGLPLRHEKLFDSDFVVIAPAAHPLVGRRRVGWADLGREDWIMPGRDSLVRRVLEETFAREGIGAPVPVVESTSPVTNYRLVATGVGICAVQGATFRALKADGLVKVLRVAPLISPGPVALIHRAGPVDPRLASIRALLGLPPAAEPGADVTLAPGPDPGRQRHG